MSREKLAGQGIGINEARSLVRDFYGGDKGQAKRITGRMFNQGGLLVVDGDGVVVGVGFAPEDVAGMPGEIIQVKGRAGTGKGRQELDRRGRDDRDVVMDRLSDLHLTGGEARRGSKAVVNRRAF